MAHKPDLTYYDAVMAGKRVPMFAEDPQHGYYRWRREAVAIYPDQNTGAVIVTVNGIPVTDDEARQNAWVGGANKPIELSVYRVRMTTGRWPEEEAIIKESDSTIQNLAALAKKAKILTDRLKEREKAREEDPSIPILENQADADGLAGYIQQFRAFSQSAEEAQKLMLAPINEQAKEIKVKFSDPLAKAEEAKDYFLHILTIYGKQRVKEANSPDYKFAAGKAGDGKTIALKSVKVVEIDDYEKLLARFKDDDKVREAVLKAAIVAYKAEKVLPDGAKETTDFEAV